jgi:hypothetical protein
MGFKKITQGKTHKWNDLAKKRQALKNVKRFHFFNRPFFGFYWLFSCPSNFFKSYFVNKKVFFSKNCNFFPLISRFTNNSAKNHKFAENQ